VGRVVVVVAAARVRPAQVMKRLPPPMHVVVAVAAMAKAAMDADAVIGASRARNVKNSMSA
jgi:hypothetical protein